MASLFKPGHRCDMADSADLQSGEQVHGTAFVISPLLVENVQEQGLKALPAGSSAIRRLGHSLERLQFQLRISGFELEYLQRNQEQ